LIVRSIKLVDEGPNESVAPDHVLTLHHHPATNSLRNRRKENHLPIDKMPQYTSRDVGDPSQIKKNKQSMADLKLRRLTELNNRLKEDLERERIPVSNAAKK
jgi:hypothetical protein